MSSTRFHEGVRRHECASPPQGEAEWECSRKPPENDIILVVVARTAFAAGKIAEQTFDCHWSDLDIKLVSA